MLIVLANINILNISIVFSMQEPVLQEQMRQAAETLANLEARSGAADEALRKLTHDWNNCLDIACASNVRALDADKRIKKLLPHLTELETRLDKIRGVPAEIEKQIKDLTEAEIIKYKESIEALRKMFGISEDTIVKMGGAMANAEVEKEKIKLDKLSEFLHDPKLMVEIVGVVVVIVLSIYIIKYGTPALMNYLTRPHVISETSRPGLFDETVK